MPNLIRPAVVFHPNLIDGMNVIANVVKPTLGPLPRTVGIEGAMRDRAPELLDDAGAIARRIVQIAGPTADAGAMMMRHALWRMHEQCGDGAATMAVIAQALMQQATKAVAAGAHPALLRQGIERGMARAIESLRRQSVRLPGGKRGREMLASLAKSLCHDDEMRGVLVEIVDIMGADGAIHVVNNDGRRIDREYVEGAWWESPWLTTGFATDTAQTIGRISDAAVVILDGKLDTATNVLEGLKRLYNLNHTRAAIIAADVSDEAKGILIQAKLSGTFQILPIKAPGFEARRAVALQDLAALTGARVLFGDGAGFANVTAEDIGEVRRAWASGKQFGIIGGKRDPIALRNSIAATRRKIDETQNLDEIAELRMRLGRLSGGLAIVRVGAATSRAQEERKDQAIRLSRALQMAAHRGMVAGGGAALLACQRVLTRSPAKRHPISETTDYQMGLHCVARALEAPLRTIASNAGFDPSETIGLVRAALRKDSQSSCGFDVRSGAVTDMMASGIVDSAEVIERALHVAGSLVAMAITTDAVVHHRKPTLSTSP